ncbi:hypothetical protein AVEN_48187-1 [Araneus ventricosus]|uniref:Coiled-coil domain-containing protein 34 n=2 Tax=Araneus ventricosus TaxID=182803 RepID=A0A4Y2J8C1_ARAVE|nr:hypothetical protein AVEN_48187-1 [Araneus ventricosus]
MLKQKMSEKFDKEQEQVVESLMEKKEKKMEADAAFTAWKQHKSHLMKMEKKKRAWVMQKKREEEEKQIARDREALIVYRMWLESKNPVKHDTFSPVKAKPPWTPPGKCEEFYFSLECIIKQICFKNVYHKIIYRVVPKG